MKDEGDLYLLWSKYDEALVLFNRGLEIYENTFGSTHPNYADTEASIGSCRYHQGKPERILKKKLSDKVN